LDPGGVASSISVAPTSPVLRSKPATYNLGADVRLAEDIAFFTYGVTNRLDASVGLPMVHASMAASMYNGQIYTGDGLGGAGDNCWCTNTFKPGVQTSFLPSIGAASRSRTGLGDVLLRLKANIFQSQVNPGSNQSGFQLAAGIDVRLPTGDEKDFLGIGAVSAKPFIALSLFSKDLGRNVILAPHLNAGWQFVGKSSIAGTLTATSNSSAAPFSATVTKDYVPDAFTWGAGTELAIGRHTTLVADILGNQIGFIHGIPTIKSQSVADTPGFSVRSPFPPFAPVTASGFVPGGRASLGQYSGSFGYKVRITGGLVATFNMLVRFDHNGLTARVVPLYGLGYSFR
jgi:hypothetical protein